ncbi:GDP-mannose 4,6 dehydratase [Xylaria arbuscula]|nr:GDP-mannose 4,6 dehydratase [Xylaria arbuscula]
MSHEGKGDKIALITGIGGQDGSYLAELLLQKGYIVHGLVRRNSSTNGANLDNISSLKDSLVIHKGDVTDALQMMQLVRQVRPDEIYHLAGQTHVSQSFHSPAYTMEVNALGTLNMLEAVASSDLRRHTRLYNAATSEIFGGTEGSNRKLTEESALAPKSPYGISKLSAYWLVRNYRDSHGLWVVNGILFNHESPRRGSSFVTMRIARAVALHTLGHSAQPLTLAGLNMERDWGHARDYVAGIWAMLQQEVPRDLLLATGEKHSVKDFIEVAFQHVGVSLCWGNNATCAFWASNANTGEVLVQADPALRRPVEVQCLLGDNSQARHSINWSPKTTFHTLVKEMVDSEIRRIQQVKR